MARIVAALTAVEVVFIKVLSAQQKRSRAETAVAGATIGTTSVLVG